jgi:hypothetical protein
MTFLWRSWLGWSSGPEAAAPARTANAGMACGECLHARRYWGTLRCVRGAPRDARDEITRAAVSGSPYCETERRKGRLVAAVTSRCGRDGRYWAPNTDVRVHSVTPRRLFLLLHDRGEGDVTGYVFSSRDERDAGMSRLAVEALYVPADVEVIEVVP